MELVKCILRRKSTNEILNFNYMVNSELLPPSGLDPDLEVLAYYEPFEPSVIDSRIKKHVVTASVTNIPHPVYSTVNQYLITYSEESCSNEELIIAVKNEEKRANQLIYNGYDMTELNTKGHTINAKLIKKQTLEPWEGEIETALQNIAAKIQNNQDIKNQKIALINENQRFDIDFGWIKS